MADRWGINEDQYKKVQYFAQGRSIQLLLLEFDGTISVQIDNVWYDIGTPKFTQTKIQTHQLLQNHFMKGRGTHKSR